MVATSGRRRIGRALAVLVAAALVASLAVDALATTPEIAVRVAAQHAEAGDLADATPELAPPAGA